MYCSYGVFLYLAIRPLGIPWEFFPWLDEAIDGHLERVGRGVTIPLGQQDRRVPTEFAHVVEGRPVLDQLRGEDVTEIVEVEVHEPALSTVTSQAVQMFFTASSASLVNTRSSWPFSHPSLPSCWPRRTSSTSVFSGITRFFLPLVRGYSSSVGHPALQSLMLMT